MKRKCFQIYLLQSFFPLTYSPVWTLTERIIAKNDPKAKNKPCTNERLVKIVFKKFLSKMLKSLIKSI